MASLPCVTGIRCLGPCRLSDTITLKGINKSAALLRQLVLCRWPLCPREDWPLSPADRKVKLQDLPRALHHGVPAAALHPLLLSGQTPSCSAVTNPILQFQTLSCSSKPTMSSYSSILTWPSALMMALWYFPSFQFHLDETTSFRVYLGGSQLPIIYSDY